MDEKGDAFDELAETVKALEAVWGEHFLIQVGFVGFYFWSDFSVIFRFYQIKSFTCLYFS